MFTMNFKVTMNRDLSLSIVKVVIGALLVLMAVAGVETVRGSSHITTPVSNSGQANQLEDSSTDATLSDLEITDPGSSDIPLTPDFDPGTTDYTASVENVVDFLTVTGTMNYTGASLIYLDENDSTLEDADADRPGHQVYLAEGENTFKVSVTSADTTETKNYTVVVTRLPPITSLVSNTHLTRTDTAAVGRNRDGQLGQRFTTGAHPSGYLVTSVGMYVHAVGFSAGETVTVRIHEFNPVALDYTGPAVIVLTTPTLTAGEVNFFSAPEGATLEPGTEYLVNFHSTGDSLEDLRVGLALSDDQRGATGWLIKDSYQRFSDLSTTNSSIMIDVRGDARAPYEAKLSDLVITDSDSAAVTLTPEFDPRTTDYIAAVDSDESEVTVSPTTSGLDASFKFLDVGDQELADSDLNTTGHQVSLGTGNTTFKIEVTSEDTTETETYTVVMQREVWEATLTVRDLGSGELGCDNSRSGDLRCSASSTLSDVNFFLTTPGTRSRP